MRKLRWALAILGTLAVGGGLLVGCPATHGDFPGTACMGNADCYVGEECVNKVCQLPMPDMSVSVDFAHGDLTNPADMDDQDMTPQGDL
jgi:hypothetical protein